MKQEQAQAQAQALSQAQELVSAFKKSLWRRRNALPYTIPTFVFTVANLREIRQCHVSPAGQTVSWPKIELIHGQVARKCHQSSFQEMQSRRLDTCFAWKRVIGRGKWK